MVSYINTSGFERVNFNDAKNLVSSPVEEEINIFNSILDSQYISKYDDDIPYFDENYKTPREEFEEIWTQQGIIGRLIDKAKNKIPLLSIFGLKGSNEIEIMIMKYENAELKEYEVHNEIIKYGKNQKILTDFILNTLTGFFAISTFLIFSLFDMNTGTKFALTCLFSGILRVTAEKVEKITGGIKRENFACSQNDMNSLTPSNTDYKLKANNLFIGGLSNPISCNVTLSTKPPLYSNKAKIPDYEQIHAA